MFAFDKSLRYLEKTRRYSIAATEAGWEVREERDSEVVRKVQLRTGIASSARADRFRSSSPTCRSRAGPKITNLGLSVSINR